jgi:hypothetical protein
MDIPQLSGLCLSRNAGNARREEHIIPTSISKKLNAHHKLAHSNVQIDEKGYLWETGEHTPISSIECNST